VGLARTERESVSFRVVRLFAPLALGARAALPAAAGAQFATYTAHPAKVTDTARTPTVVLGDSAKKARADSVSRVAVSNMKAWVDSAALAVGSTVPAPVDSTPAAPVGPVSETRIRTGSRTATASAPSAPAAAGAGMRAPDTASPLPTLLVLGAGALAAGLLLLRRRA
jgi:hypothetical protein